MSLIKPLHIAKRNVTNLIFMNEIEMRGYIMRSKVCNLSNSILHTVERSVKLTQNSWSIFLTNFQCNKAMAKCIRAYNLNCIFQVIYSYFVSFRSENLKLGFHQIHSESTFSSQVIAMHR